MKASIDQTRTLKTAIGDLSAKQVSDNLPKRTRDYVPIAYEWKGTGTYWMGVRQNTLATGVTDWENEFVTDTTTSSITGRVEFREATVGGELDSTHPGGSSSYGARFFKIMFYAFQPQTISCYISFAGSSADVQMKLNGQITPLAETAGVYNSFTNLDIPVGDNTLSFALDTSVDDFKFEALLFDGTNIQWVDPNAPRNPQRAGYVNSGGGGSTGADSPLNPVVVGGS